MSKRRSRPADNRIPLSFEEAVDRLLSVDPKNRPPVVRPGKSKATNKSPAKKASRRIKK